MLNPFHAGEQLRIDDRGANGRTDLPHGLAHGTEEGLAGVLHQVPAVGNLESMGQCPGRRPSITAAVPDRTQSSRNDDSAARQNRRCRSQGGCHQEPCSAFSPPEAERHCSPAPSVSWQSLRRAGRPAPGQDDGRIDPDDLCAVPMV